MISLDIEDYHKTFEKNFKTLSSKVYRFVGSIELDAPYYIINRSGSKKEFTLHSSKKEMLSKDHPFSQWFTEQDIEKLSKDFDQIATYSETNMLGQWDGENFIVTDIETTSRVGFTLPREFKALNFYFTWEFTQFGVDVDFNDESTFDVLTNLTDHVCHLNPYSKMMYDDWKMIPAKGIVWRRSGEKIGTKYWFRTSQSTLEEAVEAAMMTVPDTSWDAKKKYEHAMGNYPLPPHLNREAFEELLKEDLDL